MPGSHNHVCHHLRDLSSSCLDRCTVKKKKRVTLGNPSAKDADGMLLDINVNLLDETPSREDKRRDIDHFFHVAVLKEVNGKSKKYCGCKLCPYVWRVLVNASDSDPN